MKKKTVILVTAIHLIVLLVLAIGKPTVFAPTAPKQLVVTTVKLAPPPPKPTVHAAPKRKAQKKAKKKAERRKNSDNTYVKLLSEATSNLSKIKPKKKVRRQ